MSAYYNEFDPKIAAWLRQLIKNGDIADGEVDERSITDVTASDLRGFTQHHFFAGIGTWSLALRNAGWPDDRSICTASLPCQPFSVAGNQKGKQDERHLLPHFIELVRQCGFDTIIGEQVPSAIKHGWLDDLYDEMERENYAVGSIVLTAAGAGKPHIRQRLYWVANSINPRHEGRVSGWENKKRKNINGHPRCGGTDSRLWNANGDGRIKGGKATTTAGYRCSADPTSGVDSIEWLYCRDNKYRPIKSGIAPLVNGATRRVVHSGGAINPNKTAIAKSMRIKGYGNAICEPTARLFIQAFMETV